jgi:hypothetical protein
MSIEYEYEIEIEVDGKDYFCTGEIEYETEDGAIGFVPYGDTQVWHPGDGDSIEVTSLTIDSATDEDDVSIIGEITTLVWKQIKDAIKEKLCEGDELIDYAKRCYEDDDASRADDARDERDYEINGGSK